MRLLAKDEQSVTFELDQHELELFLFLLECYPALDPAYHQIAAPSDRESFQAEQQMLTENMTAEQSKNRQLVQAFIRTRLTPAVESADSSDTGRVKFSLAEADWLLRVINDVRVGCWVRLGRPETGQLHSPALAGTNPTDFAAMEVGGLLQSILLHTLSQ